MTKKEEAHEPVATPAPEPAPQPATPVAPPAPVPPAYVPPQQATTHPEESQGLAITAMVLGIVSVVALGLLTGIPAIITGSIALKKKLAGRGMAIAGIVTGAVGTFFSILFIAFWILIAVLAANNHNNSNYNDYFNEPNASDMPMYRSGDRT